MADDFSKYDAMIYIDTLRTYLNDLEDDMLINPYNDYMGEQRTDEDIRDISLLIDSIKQEIKDVCDNPKKIKNYDNIRELDAMLISYGVLPSSFELTSENNYNNSETELVETTTSKQLIPQPILKQKATQKVEISLSAIKELQKNLKKNVIGQNEAIKKVSKLLTASYLGFREENKPVASMLFTGPTGVGKTETGKIIGQILFDNNVKVVDMSTFKNAEDVARLVGSAFGYIGSDEVPPFVTYLKEHPDCVVIFDEIDKAHQSALDVLMRILDEGKMQTAKGQEIDLTRAVIIATTNSTANNAKSVGFGSEKTTTDEQLIKNDLLKKELLGRFNFAVEYQQLTKESLKTIAKQKIDKVINNFEKHNGKIKIKYMPEVIDKIAEQSLIPSKLKGARAINDAILSKFSEKISNAILKNNVENGIIYVGTKTIKVINNEPKIVKEAEKK